MEIVNVVVVVPMGTNSEAVGDVRLKLGSPVPVRAILEEPLVTLSVMVRLPLITPVLVGLNVTVKVQPPPTAMVNG